MNRKPNIGAILCLVAGIVMLVHWSAFNAAVAAIGTGISSAVSAAASGNPVALAVTMAVLTVAIACVIKRRNGNC